VSQAGDPAPRLAVPGPLLYLTEPARAVVDAGLLTSTAPLLGMLPRGDGHPVLVLPGLGAGDPATFVLRRVLRRQGYRSHGWGLGVNLGPTQRTRDGLAARLDELTDRYQTPISLVGWSLGGLYAHQLSWHRTESVRQVITLGSPLRLGASLVSQLDNDAAAPDLSDFPQWPRWSAWARWFTSHQSDTSPGDGAPLPVPATSIYSVMDGIVGWRLCLTDIAPRAENIGVAASHLGFTYHPAVAFAIADRLAQPAGQWSPFRPPPALRAVYRLR